MQDKNYAILGTMLQKQSYFVKKKFNPISLLYLPTQIKGLTPIPS